MRPQSLAERLLEGLRIISDTAFRLFTDPELVATAFKNLAGQKMRRNLTLLGIVIGIFSITALLALGQALDASIEGEFERLGLNTIHIQAGEDIGSSVYARLGENDAEHIAGIPFVEQVIPFYETAGVVKSRNSEASVFIIGVETEDYPYLEQIGYLSLASGRYPDDADTDALVVYENFTTDAFDHDVPLRGTVELKDRKFRIVGISAQSDVAFGGLGITNMVFTNKKTVSDLFGEDRPTEILVSVTDRVRIFAFCRP
jgi:ABC-type antimicrobial peptide transport system permease subunit